VRYPIVHILGVPRLTHLQLIGPITNILIIYGDPRGWRQVLDHLLWRREWELPAI